ncbi:DUF2007 domain-containing protein [Pendulispora rubella]|uniref:DUF2007 domain-containing protein n=1 Tax=Pendulispora rubella TaxID=2741070 RepID=A0ABZ2LEK7_9BACT
MDAEDLVTVASFRTAPEAELAKELLENEGISAFLGNEMAAGLMPFLTPDLGGVTLQVQQKDAGRAREVLTPENAPTSSS